MLTPLTLRRMILPMNPQKTNYHHGDLRRALLDAALQRLAEAGAAALSLRGLARDVGVSATAVYRHFANKEALLAGIATEGFLGLKEETELGGREAGEDPLARLAGIGRGYVRFARRHPAHYRLMFGPRMLDRAQYPELEQAARASYAVLENAVADGVRAGALAPEDVALLSTAAWSLVHGLSSLVIDELIDPERADDQLTDRITALLARGMQR